MKTIKVAALAVVICMLKPLAGITQETPAQPQPRVIQTPFGPVQDSSPPQTPAPPVPVPAPAAPAAPPANVAATPEQQGGNAPTQAGDEAAPISLVFDNADIYQVIKIIADTLKLNYVIDPAVAGTVNIYTLGNLRRSDLLPILETILRINGATMVRTGNFYQIIPAASAIRQPLQLQDSRGSVAADDQIVMQIVRMKYVQAGEMSRLLTPYISDGANIIAHEGGNILIISERRSNLRKLLELVDLFDTNAFEGERVRLFQVKNNFAKDLITDLKTIFSGYAFSESATAIRFVPLERLNSILVITPNAAVYPEVERWLDRLDQPMQTTGARNYVYKVKNGKAVDIQHVLAQLYGTIVQVSNFYTPPAGSTALPQGTPPSQTTPFAPPQGQPAGLAAVPSGDVRIIADEINNALIIQTTTPQTYAEIERTLRELDVAKRQVLIDAQIFEVSLDDSLSFGVSAALQNRGTLKNPQTLGSFAAQGQSPPSLTGQTFAFIGRTRELVAFLNASENRSRVRTLSAPSVLVSDNMPANFQVGAEIPVPTSSSVTPVQSGGTNLFAQTITFRSTGVLLNVKPQINDSGAVTLEISQEVSQAGANTTSAVVAPVIGKSSVASTIVVQDGQTIALGGFIRENRDNSANRLPLLGRIPGLGVLFGNTSRSATRSELIILVTPTVIRDHTEADVATEELRTRLREIQKLTQ